MKTATPLPPTRAQPTTSQSEFSSLLEPFRALTDEKQDILRDVLQVYVSKDADKYSDLEKRKRLTTIINNYAKGESDEEDES